MADNNSIPIINQGKFVLPYLCYGIHDPTVTATNGMPGVVYIQVAQRVNGQFTGVGIFQKISTAGQDTNWVNISGGGSNAYTPSNPSDWNLPIPTTYSEGLDQLAERVKILESTSFSPTASLYVVAENGNDITGDGSWFNPFLTIQAAIDQAVTDGHDYNFPAEVVVLPSSSDYAGFTSAAGVNVKGLYGDNEGIRIDGTITISFTGAVLAENICEFSNLNISSSTNQPVAFGTGNQGIVQFKNCVLLKSGLGFSTVIMNNTGSSLFFDNCTISSINDTALQIAAGNVSLDNNSAVDGSMGAVLVQGGTFNAKDSSFISTGNGFSVIENTGSTFISNCSLTNTNLGINSNGLTLNAGSVGKILRSSVSVQTGNLNFEIDAAATLIFALCTFDGDSLDVSLLGTINDLSEYYNPDDPNNWPTEPESVKNAIDQIAEIINYKNTKQVYVDIENGSDTTGTGSILRPYQTLQFALSEISSAAPGNYVVKLASGDYSGAAIIWPVQLNKNVSVEGEGASVNISASISYTSLGLSDENVVFNNVGVSNPLTIDLTMGGIVLLFFANGGYNLNRIDTLAPGPQFVKIIDSVIPYVTTSSVIQVLNSLFVGGANSTISATGFLLISSSIFSYMVADNDGTMLIMASLTDGTVINGAGTVVADASSLNTISISGPTVSLLDNIQNVGFNPSVSGDWITPPTQGAEALDELASRQFINDQKIVTAPEAAAKQLTLTYTPFNGQIVLSFLGVIQEEGTDYILSGGNVIDWNGLGMDTIGVLAGDNITIMYDKE